MAGTLAKGPQTSPEREQGKGTLPELTVLLANPRGFCAGVKRAIDIVETALVKYGPPVYVRHEIVHNRFVVDDLRSKGAVFVEELDEIPDGFPVIFSAHGVPKQVPEEARRRALFYLDATCPLVSKVHREAERQHAAGRQVVLIGHVGHPEVVGTMGQLPEGAILLVETAAQAETLTVADPGNLAYITQTTLSVDDTAGIIAVLQRRFPEIAGPKKEDICYATTNRQEAVKRLAAACDALIVVGAPNSSNSQRLVEVARRSGCPRALLAQRAAEIDWASLAGIARLGITAGASAPEVLVDEIVESCRRHFRVTLQHVAGVEEDVFFKLPKALADAAPGA